MPAALQVKSGSGVQQKAPKNHPHHLPFPSFIQVRPSDKHVNFISALSPPECRVLYLGLIVSQRALENALQRPQRDKTMLQMLQMLTGAAPELITLNAPLCLCPRLVWGGQNHLGQTATWQLNSSLIQWTRLSPCLFFVCQKNLALKVA
jgi:hypothetical protein